MPEKRPARTRRAVARDERRAALLTAARDVFTHKGYHAATVDDITRAAGVAKGTFYLYFHEKREIYYEVIRGFLQLIKDIGRSVTDAAAPQDFLARAERAARLLMKVFVENRKLARLAYRESMGLDRELDRMIRGFYREIAEVEAANIRVGIELGLLRRVDPMLVAYSHIGMVERVLLASLEEDSGLPPPDRIVAEMMLIGFEGLRAR
jgi:AcrR family transcriptional regulator